MRAGRGSAGPWMSMGSRSRRSARPWSPRRTLRRLVGSAARRWRRPNAEHVAVSFTSERHARVRGAPGGAGFAPLSRMVRCRDGWARTHVNYAHHEAALRRALRIEGGSAESRGCCALPERGRARGRGRGGGRLRGCAADGVRVGRASCGRRRLERRACTGGGSGSGPTGRPPAAPIRLSCELFSLRLNNSGFEVARSGFGRRWGFGCWTSPG